MIKALALAATVATLFGGAAQAHGYGGGDRSYLPPPPYANDGRSYSTYERAPSKGFPLLGADAGVTVLGVHVGGSAKIRVGLDEELREKRYRRVKVQPAYAPPPAYGYGAPAPACDQSCGRW